MKMLLKPVLAAGLILSAFPVIAAPAAAQTIKGISVVNIAAVIGNSKAFKTAEEQRPVTYKALLDQAEARRQQIAAQLQPLVQSFEAARDAAKPNQASLQQQAAQIQQIEQSGQRELQQMLAPVSLSRAYVEEQITDKLDAAVKAASAKKKVSLVLTPDNVLFADSGYNMNQDVLAELDAALPYAQLVPPEGWLPRAMREQQAQAQQQSAPPAPPSGPQAQSR
jgi:Skp family chaperone for outer membrane proteins